MALNDTVKRVTDRIIARSDATRRPYLERIDAAAAEGVQRAHLSCSNLAHAYAASPDGDKAVLTEASAGNIGIVTAYNDMLSAHQPFERYPDIIREAARQAGGTAQVAGGVPAMCDGVTQGQPGMELSLFSRDVIALAAGVALSHNVFDTTVYLGVCDKIVPGLIMATATFGHLPAVYLPAGPMVSGLPNDEKAKVRQQFAAGEVGRDKLMEAEMASYHGPGTCTFYGTANTNQMLMEFMGLHLPGASFVNPNTPLRDALTIHGAKRALAISALGNEYTPAGRVLDERAFVNGIVGLNATGGSTNLLIHLIAMADAAGIKLAWEDFAELSDTVPLMARVYPNGLADVNHFHAAGGLGFMIGELLKGGLLHPDTLTIAGEGMEAYTTEPQLDGDEVRWVPGAGKSLNEKILKAGRGPVPADGRSEEPRRLARHGRHQGVGRRGGAARDRSARRGLRRSGGCEDRVSGRRAQPRRGGCRPVPGAEGQRHAGTPLADAVPRCPAGSRPQGRACHRRAHVGGVGQSACGHPCLPRSGGWRPDLETAGRGCRAGRCRCGTP